MKPKKSFSLVQAIRSYFKITPYMPIMQWIEKNISLVDDVSSERDVPDFTLYPYQVEILKTWEDMSTRKKVVVMASEQLGKSTMWIYGLLYRFVYDPCQSLVCYPSDSKCQETNLTKIQPLIRHIPRS